MDAIVIGDGWRGAWMARLLTQAGLQNEYLDLSSTTPGFEDAVPVFVGTGETRERMSLTFDPNAVAALWNISRNNFARARAAFSADEIPHRICRAVWQDPTPADCEAIVFDGRALVSCSLDGLRRTEVESIISLRREGAFDYEAGYLARKQPKAVRTKSIFVVSENFPRSLVEGLAEIWLPVTLNRFRFSGPRKMEDVLLFNGGVDYAFGDAYGRDLIVGSFRNLFEDRAFGHRQDYVDPKSESAVRQFASSKGWASGAPSTRQVSYESLSCDGLPLVGNLSAYPGVFLIGGFAGRTASFFFETAARMVDAFVGKSPAAEFGFLSPKRLV